jgi:prolyl 4-hydroxylase
LHLNWVRLGLVDKYSLGNVATGAFTTNTRTSKNTWVGRTANDVTETLYRRAAHLLNLDDGLLQTHTNSEEMQVVTYINGQKYDAHHDWGSHGSPATRLITLLLYLTDQETPNAGGETSFPKGANGKGFKVPPVKGNAVLFYNLLEDGNGDDLSLHAALPVFEGQKWLANFWVWDPHR